MPPSRPFSPLSLSVCLGPPHALQHGPWKGKKKKEGKRAHTRGLRCGMQCQSRPRFFHQKGHIMFGDWLSATKPLSSLINKTGHPFALIPQAAHMQECATQGKSYKRGNFFMSAPRRVLGKSPTTFTVFMFPFL